MYSRNIQLPDLVSMGDWQKTQDSLAEVLETTVRTISLEGKFLTKASRSCRFCETTGSGDSSEKPICGACRLQNSFRTASIINKETSFKCYFETEVFLVPIVAVANKIIAYVVLGPFILKSRKKDKEYIGEAKELGVDPEAALDALIEINVFSYNRMYAMVRLTERIFSQLAQSGYHKKRLGEIAPEVIKLDPLFSRYYEEKILSSLLNSCALALNADSGSVMTLDKATNMLHIKVSSQLDENIVNNTSIRVGEGIAGLAAQTAEPIILPKDMNKRGLADKLKRRYIKSSMIVPFSKGNTHDVYGVISLNITRANVDFSDKEIAIVKELVNMASIAVTPIHQAAVNNKETI